MFSSLVGCSSDKETTITDGTYVLKVEDNEEFAPSVIISDGTFTFTFDLLSSYSNRGRYLIENEILILTTEDVKYEYQFMIKDGTLVFQEKKSSPVKLIDERLGAKLADGDVFELVK